MLQGCRFFDCSQILNASWNGLLNFDRYLKNSGQQITLTNVPNHIFNYLRLMPDVNASYSLDQIELGVIELQSSDLETKNVFISANQLQDLASECTRAFLRLNQQQQLIGRHNFICPSQFGLYQSNPNAAQSVWYQNNSEQFDFWYDYFNFANTTSFLAMDLVQSLNSTLSVLLKEIELGVSQSEKALNLIIEGEVKSAIGNIEAIIQEVNNSCSELSQFMEKVSCGGKQLLLRMQLLADDVAFTDGKVLYDLLEEFSDLMRSVVDVLPKIEEIGAKTGEGVTQLGATVALREQIDKIADDGVSSEVLEQVRDVLEIMDPLSEDSWPDTKVEFCQQLDSIDKAVSDIIILLQGFDLLRQILEHRLAEASEVHGFVTEGHKESSWHEVREQVFEMVGKTLVTDQEKYSCEFFIPNAASNQQEKQSPGDVLLF
jgi:uncharacterized protein YoxC